MIHYKSIRIWVKTYNKIKKLYPPVKNETTTAYFERVVNKLKEEYQNSFDKDDYNSIYEKAEMQ